MPKWTPDEEGLALTTDYYPDLPATVRGRHSESSWRNKRREHGLASPNKPPLVQSSPHFLSDKKVSSISSWRELTGLIQQMQVTKMAASYSQDRATIVFDVDRPIFVLPISDAHLGSWATDYDAFARTTEEILATPDLYIAVLGDMEQMSIKLRNVLEISDNALPPEMQSLILDLWVEEVADKILFATWDNHSVMREEAMTGRSHYKKLMSRRVIYHNGIGHVDITVGGETYKIAASHFFRGKSIDNPVHGIMRYMRREGQDREIGIAGDSHVPGIAKYVDGPTIRLAVNSGSFQTNSGYAKRFFSLATHAVMPGFTLDPEDHSFTPYWSVSEWLAAKK